MPTNTPEPRLPLEPEEYPLYSPPKRLGCSALAILPLLLLAVFIFLFFRVAPPIAQGMVNPIRQILNIELPTVEPTPGPQATPGEAVVITATVEASVPTPTTPPPPPPPTPTSLPEEYVEVANTGGQGVRLRAEPQLDAARVDGLAEGTICKIIGPDVSNGDGTWRNVEVVGKAEQGWVLNRWLIPAQKPNP
jgi:hypothetical protein